MVSRREFVVLCGHRQRALRGNWSVIRFPIVHCRYVPRHVFNLARIHSPQTSRKRKWLINRREPRWINATVFSPPRSCYAWKSSEISFERGSVKKEKKEGKNEIFFLLRFHRKGWSAWIDDGLSRITRMDVILLFFVKVINAINAMMILSWFWSFIVLSEVNRRSNDWRIAFFKYWLLVSFRTVELTIIFLILKFLSRALQFFVS